MRKRILLFEPGGRLKHIAKIRDLFLSFPDWEVKKIGPGDKHLHKGPSCVLLPDTKGINALHSAFHQGGYCIPPNLKPQDPYTEYFLLNDAFNYIDKKRGICGIGHSAFAIFAQLLGGKLAVDPKGICATGNINEKAYWADDEHFISKDPLCAGYTGTELNEDFVAFVEESFFSGDKETVLVENPSPPDPPKIITIEW